MEFWFIKNVKENIVTFFLMKMDKNPKFTTLSSEE